MTSLGRCTSLLKRACWDVVQMKAVLLAAVFLTATVAGHGSGHHHHGRRDLHQAADVPNPLGLQFGEKAVQTLLSQSTNGMRLSASQSARLTRMTEMLTRDEEIGLETRTNQLVAVCHGLAAAAANHTHAMREVDVPHRHLLVTPRAADPDPDLSQAFLLHSRPSASKKIYLDFNGCTVSGTGWNNGATIENPPYDIDGNPGSFSDEEKSRIVQIWRGVAEDFAPFNVDVTTEEPPASMGTRGAYGAWACIGGDGKWAGSPAGVAYVDVFGGPGQSTNPYYQPAWTFSGILGATKPIWETISHEVGHTFGLGHQGRKWPDGRAPEGYYAGHGSNGQGWAPIMGFSDFQAMTQWSKGEYEFASNKEDDVALIAAKTPLINDHGSSAATATDISSSIGTSPTTAPKVAGVISHAGVYDFLKFTATATGTATVTIYLAGNDRFSNQRTNLDAELRVLDSAQTQMAIANPAANAAGRLAFSVSVSVTRGAVYYITVRGVGNSDSATGPYSAYGSLGSYDLSVALPTGGGNQCQAAGTACTSGSSCCNGLQCVEGTCGSACPTNTYRKRDCPDRLNWCADWKQYCDPAYVWEGQSVRDYQCQETCGGACDRRTCAACPPGTSSPAGSTDRSQCTVACLGASATCTAGGPACCDGMECVEGKCMSPCPADTYRKKDCPDRLDWCADWTQYCGPAYVWENQSVRDYHCQETCDGACDRRTCAACPPGTSSLPGSTDDSDCKEVCLDASASCTADGPACCDGMECVNGECRDKCPAKHYRNTCPDLLDWCKEWEADGYCDPIYVWQDKSVRDHWCTKTCGGTCDNACTACGAGTTGPSADGTTCDCAEGFGPDFDPATGTCASATCAPELGACSASSDCCDDRQCIAGKCGGKCPVGTFLVGLNECRSCTVRGGVVPITDTEGATSQSQCLCPSISGQKRMAYEQDVGCMACGEGTTGESRDGRTCQCAAGSYRIAGAKLTCGVCKIANSIVPSSDPNAEGEGSCFCTSSTVSGTRRLNHFYMPGVGCTLGSATTTTGSSTDGRTCPCLAGHAGFDRATGQCSACTFGQYAAAGAATCTACAGGGTTASTKSTSEASCRCNSVTSFYTNGIGCRTCPGSLPKATTDGRSCTCPTNSRFVTSPTVTCRSCKARNSACSSGTECCSNVCSSRRRCT